MLASAPVVSVVVVNWNAGASLDRCLASLAAAGPDTEVIVVDNASTDGSTAAATRDRPWARVIPTAGNLGFAGGANVGAAAACGDVLVFLNPDATVEPGALAELVRVLVATPEVGIAGGGLTDDDGRWQPATARFGVVPHLLCDTTLGRLHRRGRQDVQRVDWVYGTFMAVRRSVFEQLGGFDASYFIYGEDLDLCYRARAAGWGTLSVPRARARHGPNVSATGRFGLARDAAVVQGELRFYRTRRGRGAALAYRTLAAGKFALKATLAALAGRLRTAGMAARVVSVCLGRRAEEIAG